MKSHLKFLAPVLASLCFLTAGATLASAQITNPIRAHVDHSFMIGDKTLPPGDYTFTMMEGSNLGVMTVTSADSKVNEVFNVERTIDNHRPKHSELVFRKFGETEFLSKIFESGSKSGAELTESRKQEARLAAQGQHAIEHMEEQQQ
ncbi:MAG: hypothetical protein ABSH31_13440 [Bryobacteraceae bacterium]|jgi:hypothetical protein